MATVASERGEGSTGRRFVCCAPFCPDGPLDRDCASCPAALPASLLQLAGRVFLPQPLPPLAPVAR